MIQVQYATPLEKGNLSQTSGKPNRNEIIDIRRWDLLRSKDAIGMTSTDEARAADQIMMTLMMYEDIRWYMMMLLIVVIMLNCRVVSREEEERECVCGLRHHTWHRLRNRSVGDPQRQADWSNARSVLLEKKPKNKNGSFLVPDPCSPAWFRLLQMLFSPFLSRRVHVAVHTITILPFPKRNREVRFFETRKQIQVQEV